MATEYQLHGISVERQQVDEHGRWHRLDVPSVQLRIAVGKSKRLVPIELDTRRLARLVASASDALVVRVEAEAKGRTS